MKRILVWITLLMLALTALAEPAVVQGAIFGGKGNDAINVDVSFDPAWLTDGDNTVYNAELARFCVLMNADVYYREKDLDRGTPNRVVFGGEYTHTAITEELGFAQARYIGIVQGGVVRDRHQRQRDHAAGVPRG